MSNLLNRFSTRVIDKKNDVAELNPWDYLELCIAYGDFSKHIKLTKDAENALKASGLPTEYDIPYPMKFLQVPHEYVAFNPRDAANYVVELARLSREDNKIYLLAPIRTNTYDFRVLAADKQKVIGKLKHKYEGKTLAQVLHYLNLEDNDYPVLKDNLTFDLYVGCGGLETSPTNLQYVDAEQWHQYLKDNTSSLVGTYNKWMYEFVKLSATDMKALGVAPYPKAFKLQIRL